MMKYLFCLAFLISFQLSSCRANKLKTLPYIEGKGYCVEKYDEEGCNVCRFKKRGWECENKYCPETDAEKSNQCLEYKK